MNYILFVNKLPSWAVFFTFSLLCLSCSQTETQSVKDYQFSEQKVGQPKAEFISLREPVEASTSPERNKQNLSQDLYRNEILGIGFPTSSDVQVQAIDSVLSIWTEADYGRTEEFIEATPLLIRIEANPDSLTAQEWLSTRSYLLDGIVEEQMVGNQLGIRFDWSGMWIYTSVAVPHPTRQNMIIITWDNEMSDYEMIFESIVSGLVFI